MDNKLVLDLIDHLKSKIKLGVIVIVLENEGRFNITIALTKDLIGRLSANELIKNIASIINAKGGGRVDLASAGGADLSKLDQGLSALDKLIDNA